MASRRTILNYKFKCTSCSGTCERDIPLAEYDKQKDKQTCICGGKLVRVIEWTGIATCDGSGWCGKSTGSTI